MTDHYDDDEPMECMDANDRESCQGEVQWCPAPPRGERNFLRCEFHQEKRWERYQNSDLEKFAASSVGVIPDWYDPDRNWEPLEED